MATDVVKQIRRRTRRKFSADATLVLLAEALDVHQILTLDRRGFSSYRTRLRQHLQLVLDLA